MRTTASVPAVRDRNELRVVLVAGGLIVMIAMGIRQSFGLYLAPVSEGLGTGRETFSLAMAIQNVVLGLPLAGLVADRIGGRRVAAVGGLVYAGGLALVSLMASTGGLIGGLGVVAGAGLSAVSYVVVLGAVGRVVPPERRSSAFGVITAAGSFGMFAMVPVSQAILSAVGWETAFLILAAIVASTAVLALRLPHGAPVHAPGEPESEPFWQVVSSAAGNRNYWLLVSGFFVCGFHVAFVATHLPAYLSDQGIGASAVAWSMAMIGLLNIVGSWTFGRLGDRYRKRTLLSVLYGSRAVAFTLFLMIPLTSVTAIGFGAVIGFLWLGTVPLTSGAVAAIFGVRHLGTLYGVVFMSHQVGAFLGVWLGEGCSIRPATTRRSGSSPPCSACWRRSSISRSTSAPPSRRLPAPDRCSGPRPRSVVSPPRERVTRSPCERLVSPQRTRLVLRLSTTTVGDPIDLTATATCGL